MSTLELRKRDYTILLVALLAAFAGGTASAQSIGDCVTVEVPDPMVLPDGTAEPAGALRICLRHELSPVSALHEIRVNGRAIGLHRSRRGRSEGAGSAGPWVLFERNGGGELVLVGYAWPAGDRMATFRLGARSAGAATAAARNAPLVRPDPEDESVILLIARAD
jgi:hypothetical protein